MAADERPTAATNGPPDNRADRAERRPPPGFSRRQRIMWVRHLADTGDWYSAIVQLADLVEEHVDHG